MDTASDTKTIIYIDAKMVFENINLRIKKKRSTGELTTSQGYSIKELKYHSAKVCEISNDLREGENLEMD